MNAGDKEHHRFPVAELIRDRRTVRVFKEDPVPHELLLELLDTANWAPNHGRREPWRYIAFRGEARAALTEAVLGAMSAEEKEKYAENRVRDFGQIPLHIVVSVTEDPRQKQRDEDFAAVCCWVQNFQLAAWERGIGVVWKTNTYIYAPAFRQAIGIPDGEKVVGVLHVGYPELVPEPRPRTTGAQRLDMRE